MILSNILALQGPKLSGAAINSISSPNGVDFESVFYYCGLMAIFYILSALTSYLSSFLMIKLSREITYKMRKEVFDHLQELPIGFFDTHQTGDIISRISYDIDTVNASLSSDVLQICASLITVIGSLIMMLTISPILVLVFALTVPISIIFTKYKTTKIRPLFRKRSLKLGELNGYAEEMLTGHKTIKAYGREDRIVNNFDKRNIDAVDAYYDADYHGCIIGPSVNFINNLSLSLISFFGTFLFMYNKIEIGNVGSFILYSRKFSGPINEMANIVNELQSACSAAERVFKIIDEPSELKDVDDAITLNDVEGRVDIDNVSFGYTAEKTIIKDLNLNVSPGKMIAIVGPTGGGKTTIINLLMRFYDVDKGGIYVDSNEIKNVTRSSLRGAYTMVLQDTWLFNGSVFENISYGKQDATLDDVIRVAKAAHIHNYIESLPDGYDTVLSDDGVNISKGQKQLITIARAMLVESPMLILDEATSNVDSRTEMLIQDAMLQLMKDKTCFVIAHRLSTVENADEIIVIKDGMIVESGNHEYLLKSNGYYASLYNSQFN